GDLPGRRGGILGPDEPPRLAGVRVGAAGSGLTRLSARPAGPGGGSGPSVPEDGGPGLPRGTTGTTILTYARGRGSAGRPGQAVRRRHGRGRRDARDSRRRILLAPRALGLRQDHHAQADRRIRTADGGTHPPGRRGYGPDPSAQAKREHGVPELRAVPVPERGGERRVRPSVQEPDQGRGEAA